jgi:Predicted membrane protein
MTNKASILSIIATLSVGLIIGYVGSVGSLILNDYPLFILCACIPFIIHWIVFIPSMIKQTEHYFDLMGSISYVMTCVVSLYLVALSTDLSLRSIIIASLITIWAIRLGSFLFLRVKREGRDNRFNVMKTKFWWFLFTWTLGGLWVFVTMCAGLAAITSGKNVDLFSHPLDIIGLSLWIIGFITEVIADNQKSRFRSNPENANNFINEGLWKRSRHPNYFGEITLWLGITLMALPVLSGLQLITLISPIFDRFCSLRLVV